jgi:hypothetical protein
VRRPDPLLLGACLALFGALACKRPDSTGGSLSEDTPSPLPEPTASSGPPVFRGTYHSTEGLATITEEGAIVSIHYPGGTAECTPAGKTLACTWHEGEDSGAAKLTQIEGRKLVGTWGVGKSATSGGTWEFIPAKD